MSQNTSISESKNENMIVNDSQKTIETKYQINPENIQPMNFLNFMVSKIFFLFI